MKKLLMLQLLIILNSTRIVTWVIKARSLNEICGRDSF